MRDFPNRTKHIMTEKHITQRELARKAEITEASMSRYLSGQRVPKGSVIVKIAEALGTTPNILLGVTNEDKISKKELLEIIHDIYAQNLYCMEDYCEKDEKGYDCEDCLYNAIVRSIKAGGKE